MYAEGLPRVTGGAGTLGFAASKALLEHGLSGLMIFDLNPAQAEHEINELQRGGCWSRSPFPIKFFSCDNVPAVIEKRK
jgi:hypothetical protein